MAECTPELRVCLSTALCLLTGVMLACLVRAIRGPRYTERLVALNLICTVVVLMVCILSYLLEAAYLVDVAILYGLLNLLAVGAQPHFSPPAPGEEGGGAMTVRSFAAVCLLALGVLVVVIAAVGMFRFRRTLELLQASALADTLGLLLILAGLALLCGFTVHTAKLVLLVVILWAVNPVSAHLIARMEVITGLGMEPDHLQEKGEQEL